MRSRVGQKTDKNLAPFETSIPLMRRQDRSSRLISSSIITHVIFLTYRRLKSVYISGSLSARYSSSLAMGIVRRRVRAISSSRNSSFSNQIDTGSEYDPPVSTLSERSEDDLTAGSVAFLSSRDSRYLQSSVYRWNARSTPGKSQLDS